MPTALAFDRDGIGLLPFGSSGAAKVLALSGRGTAAVAPSRLTIATDSYPLVRRLYLYAAPAADSPVARRFMNWVSSPAGQQVVEAAGFVPLTVRTEATALSDATLDRPAPRDRRRFAGVHRASASSPAPGS